MIEGVTMATRIAAVLTSLTLILVAVTGLVPLAGEEEIVFEMLDPVNDDMGFGPYQYPTGEVFTDGSLDLRGFKVLLDKEAGKLKFIVSVLTLGNNTCGSPFGFCAQAIHVYVHAGNFSSGRTDTLGLNVNVRGLDRWHFAVIVTPYGGSDSITPTSTPFPTALVLSDGTIVSGRELNVYTNDSNIVVEIPTEVLGEYLSEVSEWRYVVVLTAYSPNEVYGVAEFNINASSNAVGGVPQQIKELGLEPRVMDLLAPNISVQVKMLKSFNITQGTLANIAAVPYLEGFGIPKPCKPRVEIVTETETVTERITETEVLKLTVTSGIPIEYVGPSTYGLLLLLIATLVALAYVLSRSRKS